MNAPTPRLEFRWRTEPETECEKDWKEDMGKYNNTYFCDYGIVLPLRHTDIRAEGEDGTLGVNKEVFYKFRTTCTNGSEPCKGHTPFRDGVHALWDAEALGNLPIWVLTHNGEHSPIK